MTSNPLETLFVFLMGGMLLIGLVLALALGVIIGAAVLFSRHQRNSIESWHPQVRSPAGDHSFYRRRQLRNAIAASLLPFLGALGLMLLVLGLYRSRSQEAVVSYPQPAPLVEVPQLLPPIPPMPDQTIPLDTLSVPAPPVMAPPAVTPPNGHPPFLPSQVIPTLPRPSLPQPTLPPPQLTVTPEFQPPSPERASELVIPPALTLAPAEDAPVSAQAAVDQAHARASQASNFPLMDEVTPQPVPVELPPPALVAPAPVLDEPPLYTAPSRSAARTYLPPQPNAAPAMRATGLGVITLAAVILCGAVMGVLVVIVGFKTWLPKVFSASPVSKTAVVDETLKNAAPQVSLVERLIIAVAVGPAVLLFGNWFIQTYIGSSANRMPAPMLTDKPHTGDGPPAWIQPDYRSPQSPPRATISSALFATPSEATTGAQAAIRKWANSQLQRLGKAPLPPEVQDWMIGSVSVVDVYRETVEHDFGTFQAPMHRMWVEVEWSSGVARRLEDLRDGGRRSDRLLVLSIVAGLVVTLAASVVTWCDARLVSPHSTLLPFARGGVVLGTYVSCILLFFA